MNTLEILVGTIDLSQGGNYYKVKQFVVHEQHNRPVRLANDVATIEVKQPIQFNANVKPIELSREEVPDGVEVQLSGWGSLKVRT